MKFKVGQRVRVTANYGDGTGRERDRMVGETLVITEIDNHYNFDFPYHAETIKFNPKLEWQGDIFNEKDLVLYLNGLQRAKKRHNL